MAQTPSIDAPQGGSLAVVEQVAKDMNSTSLQPMAVYNVPSQNMKVTYGNSFVVYRAQALDVEVTSSRLMAVVRGKIDNPKLKAWTYTLDGHDFYVLRLGTYGRTLVYDLSTGEWSWWSSNNDIRWRPSIGINWRSSDTLPNAYGSNVVVGDDSYGVLWVLDPNYGLDQGLLDAEKTVKFPRVATGQMINRLRNFRPCYQVYLTASTGEPAYTGAEVTLSYSDDIGHTFKLAGSKTVVEEDYSQELAWRSLGRIAPAGRIFRIYDEGAFARIDSLDVLDGSGE